MIFLDGRHSDMIPCKSREEKKLETINYHYGHNKSLFLSLSLLLCKYFLYFPRFRKNILFILLLLLEGIDVRLVICSRSLSILFWCPLIEFSLSPTDSTEVSFVFFNILFPNVLCHFNNKIIKTANILIQLVRCVFCLACLYWHNFEKCFQEKITEHSQRKLANEPLRSGAVCLHGCVELACNGKDELRVGYNWGNVNQGNGMNIITLLGIIDLTSSSFCNDKLT